MKKLIKKNLKRIINFFQKNNDFEDKNLILNAKIFMSFNSWKEQGDNFNISSKEFQIYSQFGDDGIIQFLIYKLEIENNRFIEFGVGDYFESNTHFLLINNNWSGFVIDGSETKIDTLRSSEFFWRYDLNSKVAFINKENINDLLLNSNFSDIGLLHIDLDGNDYWILKAIDMDRYNPDILILEYNSNFGPTRAITIPYDPEFSSIDAHYSGQYYGASLSALNSVANEKGYYFIGCNSAGNNAYFIKNNFNSIIQKIDVESGFVSGKFRDGRDADGKLLFSSRQSCIESIKGMPVFNIKNMKIEDF